MKTARQILRSFFHLETEEEFNERDKNIPEASAIYGAMEEYARQEAIEFGKWIDENIYTLDPSKGWFRVFNQAILNNEFFSDEQLYKKFKDENNHD